MIDLIKRLLPHLLWVAGIGLIVLAVLSFGHHGVPYQDPTPEQTATREAGLSAFNWTSLFGSFLFLLGVIWAATRSLKNRERPET